MHGLCEKGMVDEAFELLERMQKEKICVDVMVFNVLINGLRKKRRIDEAIERFEEGKTVVEKMILKGFVPSYDSFKGLVLGFCKEGLVEEVDWGVRVRGVMYYREALKLQAFLDMAEDEDILEGYETAEKGNRALFARLEALADMKYTYVVICQSFALQKAMNDPRYKDTIELMTRYPSLRVSYVEEKEEIVQGRPIK
ncbi:hypothetical protein TSUD_99660, partial [Trifolium subterraneum]